MTTPTLKVSASRRTSQLFSVFDRKRPSINPGTYRTSVIGVTHNEGTSEPASQQETHQDFSVKGSMEFTKERRHEGQQNECGPSEIYVGVPSGEPLRCEAAVRCTLRGQEPASTPVLGSLGRPSGVDPSGSSREGGGAKIKKGGRKEMAERQNGCGENGEELEDGVRPLRDIARRLEKYRQSGVICILGTLGGPYPESCSPATEKNPGSSQPRAGANRSSLSAGHHTNAASTLHRKRVCPIPSLKECGLIPAKCHDRSPHQASARREH